MDYIEQKIKNSFDKIPKKFKDRIGYEVVAKISDIDINSVIIADDNKLIFIIQNIDRQLQEYVDLMIVKALAKEFGFTEGEAHELLLKVSKDNDKKTTKKA